VSNVALGVLMRTIPVRFVRDRALDQERNRDREQEQGNEQEVGRVDRDQGDGGAVEADQHERGVEPAKERFGMNFHDAQM
jgi:hypothetical protein